MLQPLTPAAAKSLASMDDTFTELEKKVGQLYKQALYCWLDGNEKSLPSCWCPLYSAKHVRLGRSSRSRIVEEDEEEVEGQAKEAFSAYFTETKKTPFGGSVQANCFIDPKCLVYYFEIKVNKLKSGAVISLGFGELWSENYKEKGKSSKLPGELWNTFGWLSNGDLLCSDKKVGSIQSYGLNDIVGIGLNFVDGTIFCTKKVAKNDYFVIAYKEWQVQEFRVVPKVGFRKNAEICANFGQNHFEYHQRLINLIEVVKNKPAAEVFLTQLPTEVSTVVNQSRLKRLKKLFPFAADEPLPSRWSQQHKRYNLQLSACGLEVSCKKICPDFDCAGSVRSDVPIPIGFPFFYFEIKILQPDKENSIAIGICSKNVHLGRLPGRFFYSYGYHSDGSASGPERREKDKEQKIYRYCNWQPKFKKDDVIGCGLNFADKECDRDRSEVFFTVNGAYMGFAYYYLAKEHWFPMVGMKLSSDCIRANFGQEDFVFDVSKYISENVRPTSIVTAPTIFTAYSEKYVTKSLGNKKLDSPKSITPSTQDSQEKVSIVSATVLVESPLQNNSCARVRSFVGKQARMQRSKTVAAEYRLSNQQLSVPYTSKSITATTNSLRDPRLPSLNSVSTISIKAEPPDHCLAEYLFEHPSVSLPQPQLTCPPSCYDLLKDSQLSSSNSAWKKPREPSPLKPCLKKSLGPPIKRGSATPFKAQHNMHANRRADQKRKLTSHDVADRPNVLVSNELLNEKSVRDLSAKTASSSTNSSCQNLTLDRFCSSQVKLSTSLCNSQKRNNW